VRDLPEFLPMPRFLRLFAAPILTLALIAVALPAAAAEPAAAPEAIADFTLPNLEGGNTSLSDHLGDKVILINFWATWCTPCMKEMPKLNEMQKEHADTLQIISISADEAKDLAKVKAIVKRFNYEPIVLLDAETKVVSQLNKRKDMPYTLVIGKDKMIHHRKKGFTDGDEEKLKEWVLALMK
jgi:thiol-disulfide isomerase/thioredoxin